MLQVCVVRRFVAPDVSHQVPTTRPWSFVYKNGSNSHGLKGVLDHVFDLWEYESRLCLGSANVRALKSSPSRSLRQSNCI